MKDEKTKSEVLEVLHAIETNTSITCALLTRLVHLAEGEATVERGEIAPEDITKEDITTPLSGSEALEILLDQLPMPLLLSKGYAYTRGKINQSSIGWWGCTNPQHDSEKDHLDICPGCIWSTHLRNVVQRLFEEKKEVQE